MDMMDEFDFCFNDDDVDNDNEVSLSSSLKSTHDERKNNKKKKNKKKEVVMIGNKSRSKRMYAKQDDDCSSGNSSHLTTMSFTSHNNNNHNNNNYSNKRRKKRIMTFGSKSHDPSVLTGHNDVPRRVFDEQKMETESISSVSFVTTTLPSSTNTTSTSTRRRRHAISSSRKDQHWNDTLSFRSTPPAAAAVAAVVATKNDNHNDNHKHKHNDNNEEETPVSKIKQASNAAKHKQTFKNNHHQQQQQQQQQESVCSTEDSNEPLTLTSGTKVTTKLLNTTATPASAPLTLHTNDTIQNPTPTMNHNNHSNNNNKGMTKKRLRRRRYGAAAAALRHSTIRDQQDASLDTTTTNNNSQSSQLSISTGGSSAVLGAGTDVFAVQDAGNHRLLMDQCLYLCSCFTSSHSNTNTTNVLELAQLLSLTKSRTALYSNSSPSSIYTSLLSTLPTNTNTNNNIHEWAMVSHFLALDCVTHPQAATANASMAWNFRKLALQHPTAIKAMAQLILHDPILLYTHTTNKENPTTTTTNTTTPTSTTTNTSASSTSHVHPTVSDPTKMGRSRKRRRTPLNTILEHPSNQHPTHSATNNDKLQKNSKPLIDIMSPTITSFTSSHNLDFYTHTPPIIHNNNNNNNKNTNHPTNNTQHHKQLQQLARIIHKHNQHDEHKNDSLKDKFSNHTNNQNRHDAHEYEQISAAIIALRALMRILNGETPLLEPEELFHDHDNINTNDIHNHTKKNDKSVEATEYLKNPMIYKNVMLRRTGTLPILSQAMSQALITLQQKQQHCANNMVLTQLQTIVHDLASILDGACCLSDDNRTLLCQPTTTTPTTITTKESGLMFHLIQFLSHVNVSAILSPSNTTHSTLWKKTMADILLSSIRTMTSLTHENELAAEQLLSHYNFHPIHQNQQHYSQESTPMSTPMSTQLVLTTSCNKSDGHRGVVVVFDLLHRLVLQFNNIKTNMSSSSVEQNHHSYDAIIFCLNLLSNILESSVADKLRQTLLNLAHHKHNGHNVHPITWLTRWIVRQTDTYRDALLMGQFGSTGTTNANKTISRDLQKHEEEYLVLAGNGFVLLACLMRTHDPTILTHISQLILTAMPTSTLHGYSAPQFMIKTLKAFCNFYHYSVGDLSVAVVTPVLKLIQYLELLPSQITHCSTSPSSPLT